MDEQIDHCVEVCHECDHEKPDRDAEGNMPLEVQKKSVQFVANG